MQLPGGYSPIFLLFFAFCVSFFCVLRFRRQFESGGLEDMSKDNLTMYMLEILDRYELPHTIKCAENFKFLHYVPF